MGAREAGRGESSGNGRTGRGITLAGKRRGSGEGTIFEESPGKWVASMTVGYVFKNGKRVRVRKKFSASTRREVAEKLKTALHSQQIGVSVAPNKRTVGWFLKYWIDEVVTPGDFKPKTVTFYRYVVDSHLIPAIGDVLLDKRTGVHVTAMLNDKRRGSSERTGNPLSARTIAGIRRTLRTALEVALEEKFVYTNVAASRQKGRTVPEKVEAKFLELSEARALLAAAGQNPLYYALFATILSLGMRLGEALALGWDDVDLARGRLSVRYTLQKVKGEMVRLIPKSDRSRRTINLPAVTIAALSEHAKRQEQAEEWAGTGWKGNPWELIFTSSVGTPLDERNVLRIFQERVLTRAGLPKMRIHDLRHSAAAILIAQGVDARSISELLGHSSVAFTLQVYGHLLESTKKDTAEKMDAALAPVALVLPRWLP
jgi:integrase